MTDAKPLPEITGVTPFEVDRSFKAAFAAATPAGEKQPPRDVLAQLTEQHRRAQEAIMESRKRNERSGSGEHTPRAPKSPEGTVLTKDGNALSRPSLSFAAWSCTKGIGGEKVERIGVADLRALIVAAGVAEPETSSWSVKLPNGVTLAQEIPGQPLPARSKHAPEAPAKPASKKAPAAKKAGKPATPTAKQIGTAAAASKSLANRRTAKAASK